MLFCRISVPPTLLMPPAPAALLLVSVLWEMVLFRAVKEPEPTLTPPPPVSPVLIFWAIVVFVTCIDVLEHIEDDVEFLRHLKAHSARYVLAASVQGRMRPGEREIGHVRNYQKGEMQEKMKLVGLNPVRTVQWGFPFYSPLFRSSVSSSGSEDLSYGRYGFARRRLCDAIYALFLLNSWDHGDRLYVLGEIEKQALQNLSED